MIVYLDTSSLVKLYVEETGSGKIRDIAYNATVISTSKAAYAEARAASALQGSKGKTVFQAIPCERLSEI